MNSALISRISDLIASDSWVNYTTVPVDFKGSMPAAPYLRVNLVGAGNRAAYSGTNSKRIDGQLIIQIITESGRGSSEAGTIGSALDGVLEDAFLGDDTQLSKSTLQPVGFDPKDSSKYIYQYSIPIRYFGE